ncbi:hypothetical protein [Streptomyces mirabilis]|uniref:hypothetical protein n=1 Tax=Streptomyces mirabilis TaxID=68239 RepID=UPI0035D838D3
MDVGQCVEKAAAAPFAPVSFDDFDQPSPGLPFEDSAVLRETVQRIMAGVRPQARAICGLIWEGKVSQKEIGDELGMTSRSVEGHMRRLRTRAKALAAKGEIEALYRAMRPAGTYVWSTVA